MPGGRFPVRAGRARVQRELAKETRGEYIGTCAYRESTNTVRELYELRRLVDELIDSEIIRGRELGASWDLLGTSRQHAQQRAARARQRQQELTNRPSRQPVSSTAID
jgi:hypothetical protein